MNPDPSKRRQSEIASTVEDDETTNGDEWQVCSACHGNRLRPESLAIRLGGLSIAEITHLSLDATRLWFAKLSLSELESTIAKPILAEMMHRIDFLCRVGVEYLTLDRPADTLSGGELQRVRLATCLGSGLVGVCYILDEHTRQGVT